jgi:FMN-dependent oxidoreductase (nitrilotriacetate monooxygenase family)
MSTRQIHLAAHFPGVNNTTVWSDPASGSHIDFASFVHLAQTAERAKFDFFFLAEGLSLREHAGHVHDLDVVGRPESFTILAALAAVTERIGLMATLTATYHEPYELARALGTLDHLSDGRAGWNLVTSTDALTGRNFSRGGYLDYGDRYVRGRELLESATQLWHSWAPGDLVADAATGRFLARPDAGAFAFHGEQVDIEGRFTLPRPPQGRPVVIQAGDSADGREFAAEHADGIFTRHGGLEDGRAFYADVKARMQAYGREPDELLILPGVTFVLGDTDEEAREQAEIVRRQQVSGPTAMVFLEQLWNRDLSAYDPDGPLPDVDPIEGESTIAPGSIPARSFTGRRQATADEWRAEATAENLSIRDLMVRRAARQTFVGSAATIADQLDLHVQTHACDGFILVPHITPAGLDRFADEVVPLLQERGSFRTEYEGTTLREHLGLAQPWPGAG